MGYERPIICPFFFPPQIVIEEQIKKMKEMKNEHVVFLPSSFSSPHFLNSLPKKNKALHLEVNVLSMGVDNEA